MTVRGIDVHVVMEGETTSPTVVLLHGFSGSVKTWSEVMADLKDKFRVIAIDLIGHGQSAVIEDSLRYGMNEQIVDLEEVFNQLDLKLFSLVGYSMGGRIALAYAAKYPERVTSLILESASPGLATEEERSARRKSDKMLAEKIIQDGIDSFVDLWENIPLFDSQKDLPLKYRNKVRVERIGQNEIGLANSLLGIGTGSQPSYWSKLNGMTMPVLLITGEYDKKFIGISREMEKFFPNAHELTINGTGHAIHVEKPSLFATMIEEYIDKVLNLRRL